MDYIVRPKVHLPGAGKAAGGETSPQDRLLKYIPLSIAGAYPFLENGIAEYVRTPIAGMPARWIEWFVFLALVTWYIIFLHKKFSKEIYTGWARFRLQGLQTTVAIIAFCIWTYSIKAAIWSDVYNAGLAIVLAVLFVLFASQYTPTVSPEEEKGG